MVCSPCTTRRECENEWTYQSFSHMCHKPRLFVWGKITFSCSGCCVWFMLESKSTLTHNSQWLKTKVEASLVVLFEPLRYKAKSPCVMSHIQLIRFKQCWQVILISIRQWVLLGYLWISNIYIYIYIYINQVKHT
jgi:hypothetical protein